MVSLNMQLLVATWGELKSEMERLNVPDEAELDVYISKGDRPFDPDTKFIKVRWDA